MYLSTKYSCPALAGCKCRRLYSIVADFALVSSFLDGSNRCESTREFTFTERRTATVSGAKYARCSVQILLTIENTRSESALLCGICCPFCNYRGPFLYPIGVKVGLVRYLFSCISCTWWPTSSRCHRCFWHNPLIGIITGKYEMMARKRKKADAQMTTEISVSADGDFGETKMTETPS